MNSGVATLERSIAAPAKGLGITALVFGIIALAVPLLALGIGLLSAISGDPGWSMVTALLLVPLAGIAAALLGIVALVLAIVLLALTRGGNRLWIPAAALGLVGAAVIPSLLLVLNLSSL